MDILFLPFEDGTSNMTLTNDSLSLKEKYINTQIPDSYWGELNCVWFS